MLRAASVLCLLLAALLLAVDAREYPGFCGVGIGAPSFFWMLLGVAFLLVVESVGALASPSTEERRAR